jgi:acetyl-CoA carboxylase biotin carboxyl carrier protein
VTEIRAPMQGTVIGVAAVGDAVSPGRAVVTIESMKIACPVEPEVSGTVSSVLVTVGALVKEGDLLAVVDDTTGAAVDESPALGAAPGEVARADLAAVIERHERLLDRFRPGGGRPGRTSTTSAIRAASSSTARWWSPPSGNAVPWRS